MPNSIRAFVAVKIPGLPAIRTLLHDFRDMGRAVRPVDPDGLHITLKFLGDVSADSVVDIEQALRADLSPIPAFKTNLTGLGAFPHAGRPSVIWIGAANVEEFLRLSDAVEDALNPLGFPRERRPFHPHLTLARIKARPPRELPTLLEHHAETDFGSAAVDHATLFQSELTRSGPRYTVLHKFPLAADHRKESST